MHHKYGGKTCLEKKYGTATNAISEQQQKIVQLIVLVVGLINHGNRVKSTNEQAMIEKFIVTVTAKKWWSSM